MARRKPTSQHMEIVPVADYGGLVNQIARLVDQARRETSRVVNSALTATYWDIGRRIVEFEQGGRERAEYGQGLIERLADDLTSRLGRGFSRQNLWQMRSFYLGWEIHTAESGALEARVRSSGSRQAGGPEILPTLSGESTSVIATAPILQTPSGEFASRVAVAAMPASLFVGVFPLSWSHYVRLLAVTNQEARTFYEAEALQGGWSVRQLDRQINTQFYERLTASKRKAVLREKAMIARPSDAMSVEEVVRDPYLLEFLDLKDEYSENDLEEALIRHLEWFLLEMGTGFTFVARQKRIRVGNTWYRIDLLLYHRALRCLVVVELKTGAFNHADAGQMNLYLNFAKERMTLPDEADPIGIILCSEKDDAVVKYATGGILTQVFASKYLHVLPDPERLREEILRTQKALNQRREKD